MSILSLVSLILVNLVVLGKAFPILWMDKEEVSYHLFSNDNPDPKTGIEINRLNPEAIARDKTVRTVFLVHGWLEDKTRVWYSTFTEAYLSKKETKYQVVQVDWSPGTKHLYFLSKMYTKDVGAYIGEFIVRLWIMYDIPLENFEITGHSLGAHVAGLAGQKVYDLTGRKLRRITGLDPAGPLFEWNITSEDGRLSKDDAEVVAVIHTDKNVFGFSGSCGSIEFFPNGGGYIQPGCLKVNAIYTVPCSHWRSFQYFEEALRHNKIVATKCESYFRYKLGTCDWNQRVHLGGDIYPNQTGSFYFETNPTWPFTQDLE